MRTLKMKVNLDIVNDAVKSLIQNPDQIITIDANFFIIPNRDAQIVETACIPNIL